MILPKSQFLKSSIACLSDELDWEFINFLGVQNFKLFNLTLLLLTLIKISYTFLNMKIAITFENENVFQHFGHTKQFKLYDIENNSIV